MITRSERHVENRMIRIVDNAFDSTFIALAHRWMESLPYRRRDYDTEASADVRHSIFEWTPELVRENPIAGQLWNVVHAEVRDTYAAAEPELRRVHINNTPYGDHCTAHEDSERGLTVLYYANAEWKDEWQGETIFFDGNGEAACAVTPRPGRLLFFPGEVRHRVGAPSRLFFNERLTLAFKFACREPVQ